MIKHMGVCVHCGEKQEDHCHFQELILDIPTGCICDIEAWMEDSGDDLKDFKVPKICGKFNPDKTRRENRKFCVECGHEKQCHGNKD